MLRYYDRPAHESALPGRAFRKAVCRSAFQVRKSHLSTSQIKQEGNNTQVGSMREYSPDMSPVSIATVSSIKSGPSFHFGLKASPSPVSLACIVVQDSTMRSLS